ncbi:hypothetical protein ACWEVD_28570 [Nocardia thailandica]
MGASTVDELVHRWLTGVVYFVTGTTTPHGCLLVRSSHLCEEPVASALRARYRIGEAALIERIDRAVADGDLSGHVRPQMVVRFILTVAQGIAVEAAMESSAGSCWRWSKPSRHTCPGSHELHRTTRLRSPGLIAFSASTDR